MCNLRGGERWELCGTSQLTYRLIRSIWLTGELLSSERFDLLEMNPDSIEVEETGHH